MSKMLCTCGETIILQTVPCEHEWMVVSDVAYDRLWEQKATHEQIADAMTIAIKCEKCGRFYIYWDGFGKEPTEYVPVE